MIIAPEISPIPDLLGYGATRKGGIFTFWKRKIGGRRGEFYVSDIPTKMRVGHNNYGHERLMLGKGSLRRFRSVHRLVLETFVGPCPQGMECCHKNGIPNDNRLENLRWGTHSENMQDMIEHGNHNPHRGSLQTHSVLTEELVVEIWLSNGEKSAAKWAEDIGCSTSLIWKVRHNLCWRHVT